MLHRDCSCLLLPIYQGLNYYPLRPIEALWAYVGTLLFPDVTPITAHMQSRLAIHMQTQDSQQLVEMCQDPFLEHLSRYLFESISHLYFQK